jgi:MFS family permease
MNDRQISLWHNPNYLLLWSGQALSSLGDTIQSIALPLLVLGLTHSAVQTGLVVTLETLPFPLLSLPAGVLVDRWDRRRVMIVCDVLRALAVGSVPLMLWLRAFSLPYLALVTLVCGTLATFFTLAETASLPNVVRKEQLGAALGQNYATSIASEIVGPPLGGLLYALDACRSAPPSPACSCKLLVQKPPYSSSPPTSSCWRW